MEFTGSPGMTMTEAANVPESHSEVTPVENKTEQAAPDQSDKPDPNVTANGEKLDRQTRNWRALETDRDHWRSLALQYAKPAQAAPPAATREPEPEKTLADFDYDEPKYRQYIRDQDDKRLDALVDLKFRERQERDAAQRRRASFGTRSADFAKTVDDYGDVVNDPRLNISDDMAEIIQDSDDGPALAYYLGKNPDVADKIAQLPPKVAARELGKIEARLAFEREKTKPEKVSKAPPPPPKVEGADPGSLNVKADDPESDKLSDEEWARRRNKQIAKRRA